MKRTIYCLLILASSIVSITTNALPLDCQKEHCIGIVDAGSTGSRFHIYTYALDRHKHPIQIIEQWSKKISPGFAMLDNHQTSIDAYLNTLFSDSPKATLPIYFFATGGMRLLSQPKQLQLWGYLKNWFNRQHQWQLVDAKTITGEDEGVFGWLAINYQLGNLTNKDKELVGIMDMGGASVQIAFPVRQHTQDNDAPIQQLDLYDRHISLFVYSFLGLGQTEVTHQFFDDEACFSTNYPLPQGRNAKGNAYKCQSAVKNLINSVHNVNQIVQTNLQTSDVSSWYVLGGVVDIIKSKLFEFSNNTFNNQSMLNEGNNTVCQQDWELLHNRYPNNDYLYDYCLSVAYYFALMVDGYGINAETSLNYMPDEKTADWTIGAVIVLGTMK